MPEGLEPTAAVVLRSGRYGRTEGAAGLRVRLLSRRGLVQFMARGRGDDAIRDAVRSKYAIALPERPIVARGERISFLWAGRRSWMAMASEMEIPDLESVIRRDLGSLASVSDQSDSRLLIEISGPGARGTLAKLVPIDLHPQAFGTGDTAMTLIGRIAGQVTQVDAVPTFELMVPRGYSESFMDELKTSGAEFGIDVD